VPSGTSPGKQSFETVTPANANAPANTPVKPFTSISPTPAKKPAVGRLFVQTVRSTKLAKNGRLSHLGPTLTATAHLPVKKKIWIQHVSKAAFCFRGVCQRSAFIFLADGLGSARVGEFFVEALVSGVSAKPPLRMNLKTAVEEMKFCAKSGRLRVQR
jgi:hypothetical protein